MIVYETYWRTERGKGVRVLVKDGLLILQKKERIQGKWKVTSEIELTRTHVERLYVRLPKLFELMKVSRKKVCEHE